MIIINNFNINLTSAVVLGGLGYLVSSKDSWQEEVLFGATYGLMGLVVNPLFNTDNSYMVSRCAGVALKIASATTIVFKGLNYSVFFKSSIDLVRQQIKKFPLRTISLVITLIFVEIIAYQYRIF